MYTATFWSNYTVHCFKMLGLEIPTVLSLLGVRKILVNTVNTKLQYFWKESSEKEDESDEELMQASITSFVCRQSNLEECGKEQVCTMCC